MTEKKPAPRAKERVLLVVIAVIVLGVILGGAYYQEEISTYLTLHGWEAPAAEQLVRDFVRAAHDGDPAAASMLDGDRAKPVMSGGKLKGVSHSGERGPAEISVKDLAPTGEVKSTSSRIRRISKVFGVAVEYSDGHWAEFAVGRTSAGLKIVNVSDALGDSKLPERD